MKKTNLKITVLFSLLFIFLLNTASAQWWNSTWDYCQNVTFDGALPTRTYEPRTVNLSTALKAQNDCQDVRIINAPCGAGGTEIPVQILDASAGSSCTMLFVKNQSSSDVYSAYYGASSTQVSSTYTTYVGANTANGAWNLTNNYWFFGSTTGKLQSDLIQIGTGGSYEDVITFDTDEAPFMTEDDGVADSRNVSTTCNVVENGPIRATLNCSVENGNYNMNWIMESYYQSKGINILSRHKYVGPGNDTVSGNWYMQMKSAESGENWLMYSANDAYNSYSNSTQPLSQGWLSRDQEQFSCLATGSAFGFSDGSRTLGIATMGMDTLNSTTKATYRTYGDDGGYGHIQILPGNYSFSSSKIVNNKWYSANITLIPTLVGYDVGSIMSTSLNLINYRCDPVPYTLGSLQTNITNILPNITFMSFTPTVANTSSILNATFIMEDENAGDSLTARILWYNGSVSPILSYNISATNGTSVSTYLTGGNFSKGDVINVTIEPRDESIDSSWLYKSLTKTISNIVPTVVTLTNPGNNTITGDSTPFFDWLNATDLDNDALTYDLLIANDTAFTQVKYNYSGLVVSSKTSEALPDNTYYWKVKAVDSDGASNAWSAIWNLQVNGSYPSISNVVYSPSTIYNNDTVRLNASITDTNGIFEVFVGGNWSGSWANYTVSINVSDNYMYELDQGNLSNQQNIGFRFYVNNTLGKITESDIYSFSVSNRAPWKNTNATIPPAPQYPNSTYIYLNISDPDGDTIEYVKFSVRAPNGTYIMNNVNGTSSNGFWNSTTFVPDDSGLWVWNATISDVYTTTLVSGEFSTTESVLPNAVVYSPSNDVVVNGITIPLQFYVSDNVRVSSCWYHDSLGTPNVNVSIACSNNDTNFNGLTYGTHTFKLYVNDTAGNVNFTTVTYLNQVAGGDSGGGGGGSLTIIQQTNVSTGPTCGDLVCDFIPDGYQEDVFSCPQDCRVDFDSIISGDLLQQAWFVRFGLVFLGITIVGVFIQENGKRKKK